MSITVSFWAFPRSLPASSANHFIHQAFRNDGTWNIPYHTWTLNPHGGYTPSGAGQFGVQVKKSGDNNTNTVVNARTTTDFLVTGSWQHIGFTFDGFYMTLYRNGKIVDKQSFPFILDYGTGLGPIQGGANGIDQEQSNVIVDRVIISRVPRPESWFVEAYKRGVLNMSASVYS